MRIAPATHLPSAALLLGFVLQLGCLGNVGDPQDLATRSNLLPAHAFDALKSPTDAHQELCGGDNVQGHPNFPDDADVVTKTFCQDVKDGGVMPTPHSLADLLRQFGLDFKDSSGGNGVGENPAFTLAGSSSSLVARLVTPINPRAFVFTPPLPDGGVGAYTILTFTRGEQFVEVASLDPTANQLNIYVIFFDQACSLLTEGCNSADLFTSRLEYGWSNVRVYENTTSLGNTIADCNQCHQPVDSVGNPSLRFQEMSPPFTHFFSTKTAGGQALLADFHAAHGFNEDYGPVPASMIDKSDPSLLATVVTGAGFAPQPNAFDSAAIEAEVKASAPEQPAVNVPAGTSAAWQKIYDQAVAGNYIAVPYHDVKSTDPVKLAKATSIYRDVASGTASADRLPNISDVFLQAAYSDLGFSPKAGATGTEMLVQMCHQCHNSNLDQTISRARFNVDLLQSMSSEERALAVTRLQLGDEDAHRMPPLMFRVISDADRQAMIQALQREATSLIRFEDQL
jgi:hypothetical protein